MILRQLIPANVRLFLKVNLRKAKDLSSGNRFNSKTRHPENYEYEVSIVQEIKKNSNFENKIHNLQQGIHAIDGILIQPGETFSFWKNVSQPTAKNGFQLSRNIVGGELKEDYGGGLCQLSSIIYHLALIAGLKVTERHNHSVDIYEEADRFTPLGADATVVYGYKDLRIQNQFGFPVMISLAINCNKLQCTFSSPAAINEFDIHFERTEFNETIEVNALNHSLENPTTLNKSIYKRKQA